MKFINLRLNRRLTQSLGSIKIGVRLGLGFGIIILLLAGVAYLSAASLAASKARVDLITKQVDVKIAFANRLQSQLNLMALSVRNYVLYTDMLFRNKQRDQIVAARTGYDDAIEKIKALLRDEKEQQIHTDIRQRYAEILPLLDKTLAMVDAGNVDEATEFLRRSVQTPQDAWLKSIQSMVDLQEEQSRQAIATMDQDYRAAMRILLAAVLFAIGTGVALAWLITRSITVPLRAAVKVAETVALGDLTSRIEGHAKDETGQLLLALKTMNESLVKIVGDVRQGADTIATASTEIASSNFDLSSRTEQQATALQQTAASMEELNDAVKQNGNDAGKANQLARNASEVALKGGAVVSQVVQTMGSIKQSAKRIVDIISVIDGIAFQTNILALNAAVEAARAGEQGRGFAVVAAEVRNLAQRSASAAKEIKILIGDSVENVEAGSALVDQAGATMDEIVASVKSVTSIMETIALASREQGAGIDQINQAIGKMDETTQQNAALVEQAAAAAESLQDQAGNLARAVSLFRLERAGESELMMIGA